MNKQKQIVPKWFNGEIYDKGGIVVNPLSNQKCELNNIELSMYDFIMGSLMINHNDKHSDDLKKGLTWFVDNNAEAYMILLD
tara:strand:+ start:313 stop:558 length:246 start_codon:yes stop_codon:yes gene_type:complete